MHEKMFLVRVLALAAILALAGVPFVTPVHASEVATSSEGAKAPKAEKGKDAAEGKEGEGEKKDAKKDKEKDKSITGGLFDGDPVYVHMQPFLLPVVTEKGAEQLVSLMIDLKVDDMTKANKVRDNMPRIRDAMMQVLYGGLGTGSLRNGGLINVAKLKAKVSSAITAVMGPDLVDEVLIQAISQRKM